MTPSLSRVSRFLRSRKVAIWLLLACALWSVVGTTVPQGDPGVSPQLTRLLAESPAVGAFVMSTGLNHAFQSPIFLVVAAWLAVSTAMCAWERTKWALRSARAESGVSPATITRLERSEPVAVVSGDFETVRGAVIDVLRSEGLKTRATPRIVEGRAGRVGLLGSPMFHWALALLFLTIGAGQLSRAEGLIGVPIGGSVPNTPAEYGVFDAGPLFGTRNQDLVIAVESMKLENVVDGIDRGPTPHVQILRAGRTVAERDVYPNSPLRYGSMLVHYSDRGYVGVFAIEDAQGSVVAERRAYFDFLPEAELGLGSGKLDLEVIGVVGPVEVKPAPREDPASAPRVSVALPDDTGVVRDTEIAVGESVQVAGSVLRLQSVGEYARLSVADDWSVYVVYTLFILATVGVALAVLVPSKTAWVLLERDGRRVELHLVARHQSGDPGFTEALLDGLKALDAPRQESETDH